MRVVAEQQKSAKMRREQFSLCAFSAQLARKRGGGPTDPQIVVTPSLIEHRFSLCTTRKYASPPRTGNLGGGRALALPAAIFGKIAG